MIRQSNRSRSFRDIHAKLEHIRKLISLIFVRSMTVSADISNFCIFQEAFRMSQMFPLTDKSGVRRYGDFL